jgi:predicted acylesterase/phospholipase RssA
MAARARKESDEAFLESMARELERGFVSRSLGFRALKLLWPGYTRSDLLAETFDRIFFHSATLASLPTRPALCLNVTVLNHGQVGKFSRDGFQTPYLGGVPSEEGSPPVALPGFPLARAVVASAAFPVGLPPLHLRLPLGTPPASLEGPLAGALRLSLTDGGVLENLGAQTLLQSKRFGTWNLLVSDAGPYERPWMASAFTPLRSLLISFLSADTLEQILNIMNSKENRSMRSAIARTVEDTWVSEIANDPSRHAELLAYLASARRSRRRLTFARLNQTWSRFLAGIPRWRWIELGARPGPENASLPTTATDALEFLTGAGIDTGRAREMYAELGGDARAEELNRVVTNFTALRPGDVRDLARHARWQVHLAHAVYD